MVVRENVARALVTGAVLASVFALAVVFTGDLLRAGTTTTALYSAAVNITNTGTTDLDDVQAPFGYSAADLIAGNFIESDALNSHVHKGDTDVPAMPASNRIQVEGAVQQDGTVFTEYTTAAQNTTQNDVPVLTGSPAVDDAFYFGCDNPCRILTWNTDTVGVGTWTITYEYWDGTAFTALSGVDDRTAGFTVLGQKAVTWDMPADWATRTTTGSAVSSYWGRARVSAFTSITTQPLASRARYENGQWWTWVEDLNVNNQEQTTLYLGGSSDLVTAHQIFPGTSGIITGDVAGLELGSAYSIALSGRLDFSAAGADTCILCKTGAITINVSGSAATPALGTFLTGTGGNSSGDNTGITIPATGEQTVIVASNGISGSGTWMDAGGGLRSFTPQTITDTANNLTWASNSGVDYFNYIRINTAAPAVFNFDTGQTDFATGTLADTAAYSGALGLANE